MAVLTSITICFFFLFLKLTQSEVLLEHLIASEPLHIVGHTLFCLRNAAHIWKKKSQSWFQGAEFIGNYNQHTKARQEAGMNIRNGLYEVFEMRVLFLEQVWEPA